MRILTLFIDCKGYRDCHSCVSGAGQGNVECGWCYSSASCSLASSCPSIQDNWSNNTCPDLVSISPQSISVDKQNTSLSVFGNHFVEGNYECLFDIQRSTATRISPTHIECLIPPVTQAANVLVRIAYNTTIIYSSNTLPFLFYSKNYTSFTLF